MMVFSIQVIVSSWSELLISLGELAALVVGPYLLAYLLGVVYWVALTKERLPRRREFAWGVTSWGNFGFVACCYVLLIGVVSVAPRLLAYVTAHPASAGVIATFSLPVLVPLGKVLWEKAGSSLNQAVRLLVATGEHEHEHGDGDGPCLDLLVENSMGHTVYDVRVAEIAGSPGPLAQVPPSLVALLTARGIGAVPTAGLRLCLGAASRYVNAPPADPIMPITVATSWLDRPLLTREGTVREQKPDYCMSVIDLHTAALEASPAIAARDGGAEAPLPVAIPAALAVPVSVAAPVDELVPVASGGNGTRPPTP